MRKHLLTLFGAFAGLLALAGATLAEEFKVEGYTNGLSFAPGETLEFHVSTPAPSYDITIARSGVTDEVVWRKEGIKGGEYPSPEDAYAKGPGWPVSESLEIPADWRSGFYIVTFRATSEDGRIAEWEHFFVLRSANPGQENDAVLVIATSTYNAYNNWGGCNLYEGCYEVSLHRPIMRGLISKPDIERSRIADTGEPSEGFVPDYLNWMQEHDFPMWVGAAGWASYEQHFVRWAEAEGYSFDYATSEDLEFRPELLDNYKLMVSVGHDEYWSWNMRDAVESRIDKGLNVAWFVGNSVYWQTRYSDDGRSMISYKNDAHEKDPVKGTDQAHLLTTIWSDRSLNRPEGSLLGLSFNYAGYTRIGGATPHSSGGYQVYRPDHWVFEGTGLRWGDNLGVKDTIVGYEVDGLRYTIDEEGFPVPTGEGGTPTDAIILGMAPASLWNPEETPESFMAHTSDAEVAAIALYGDRTKWPRFKRGMAAMVIFDRGEGTVFNAGSTDWVHGLVGGDAKVEQVTRNVLNRLAQ